MTRGERNQYRIEWERRRSGVEKRWRGKVKAALDQQVKFFVTYVKTEGLYAGKLNIQYHVPFEGLSVVLRSMYINAALFQANVTWSELRSMEGQKYRGFGFNKEWTDAIIAYFRLHLLNKAVLPITENTKEWIGKVLERATVEGWGVEETVNEILTKAKDINRKRARVITRTESVRAMNVGTLIGAEKSSLILDKAWIDAKDNRERPSHLRCGRQKPIDQNEPFQNGLMFPGDPNGPAKEVVNCRCSVAMVPRRDAQGRVMRKPKPQAVNPATGQAVRVTDIRPQQSAIGQALEGFATGLAIGNLINEITSE
jgi:hypothetical protein